MTRLAEVCLSPEDLSRTLSFMHDRDFLSIKEIVSSAFIKYKRKGKDDKSIVESEEFCAFTELLSVLTEYMQLNAYEEEELATTLGEEY
jgi:hypothetical protein